VKSGFGFLPVILFGYLLILINADKKIQGNQSRIESSKIRMLGSKQAIQIKTRSVLKFFFLFMETNE
jgi:hypothetical protein